MRNAHRSLPSRRAALAGRGSLATRRRPLGTASGFTLIELLLVMVILAVLAAVVVPKFASRGEDARKAAAKTEISSFKTALGMFETDNSRYPSTDEGLAALVEKPGGADLPNWHSTLPTVHNDPWGHPYIYRCPGGNGKDYDLLSGGADGHEGGTDDISAND